MHLVDLASTPNLNTMAYSPSDILSAPGALLLSCALSANSFLRKGRYFLLRWDSILSANSFMRARYLFSSDIYYGLNCQIINANLYNHARHVYMCIA